MLISNNVDIPAHIHGGADNDVLDGGRGPSVIIGDSGDDTVKGGNQNDILIGGTGEDRIIGNKGDDILIAGFTIHDLNDVALMKFLEEWNSSRSYDDRVDNITDGTGPILGEMGIQLREGVEVMDDGDFDKLTGSSGRDWYFAELGAPDFDVITGLKGNEDLN